MGRFLLGILAGTLLGGTILAVVSQVLPRPLHEGMTAVPPLPGAAVTAAPDAPVRQQPPVRETVPAIPAAPTGSGDDAALPARVITAPEAPLADALPTEQMLSAPPLSGPDVPEAPLPVPGADLPPVQPDVSDSPSPDRLPPDPSPPAGPDPVTPATAVPSDMPPVAADAIGQPPEPPQTTEDDPARAGLRREPGWKAQIVPAQTDTVRDLTGDAVLPPAQPDLADPGATLALPLSGLDEDAASLQAPSAETRAPAVQTGTPGRGVSMDDPETGRAEEDAVPGGADTPQPPASLPVAGDLLTAPDRPDDAAPGGQEERSGF